MTTYKEWNEDISSKNKMTLYEWISRDEEESVEWSREYVLELLDLQDSNIKTIHLGDCTKHPCRCNLCALQGLLEEYEKYYFDK